MTMGDRIAVMNNGKVEQIGTPIEIYNNPKTKFVAGFVGSPPMNFFNGKIIIEENINKFQINKTNHIINLQSQNLQKQFSNLNNIETIAVRPQHISITDDNNYDLDLEIFGIENLGKELIIICEYNNDKIRIITENTNLKLMIKLKIKIDKINFIFLIFKRFISYCFYFNFCIYN